MGLFKSLVDKVKGKKDELEKRAAKKAAEVAFEQTKRAAKGAIDSAGDALERAIFGDVEAKEEKAKEEPPDPFAHLKAREKEKAARDDEAAAREKAERARKQSEARIEKEVDDELAALKKKLGKK